MLIERNQVSWFEEKAESVKERRYSKWMGQGRVENDFSLSLVQKSSVFSEELNSVLVHSHQALSLNALFLCEELSRL